MALPPYSPSVSWRDYKIDTPTFKLSAVEKPDMSPFLFHMTGFNEIKSILNPHSKSIDEDHGFLKASTPKEQENPNNYHAEVVCFTESPTFCLDFFRYRSYRRWYADQSYGIGFDKSDLVSLGARPCIYGDEQQINDIITLNHSTPIRTNDHNDECRVNRLIESLFPLIMPLLENSANQGFMWEREWRYFNPEENGLIFPYSAIKIICCPENEEYEIKQNLGSYANKIEFVRTWHEYDEVTSFLKSRQKNLQTLQTLQPQRFNNNKEYLAALTEEKSKYKVLINQISSFGEFIKNIENKNAHTKRALQELDVTFQSLLDQIREVKDKL